MEINKRKFYLCKKKKNSVKYFAKIHTTID